MYNPAVPCAGAIIPVVALLETGSNRVVLYWLCCVVRVCCIVQPFCLSRLLSGCQVVYCIGYLVLVECIVRLTGCLVRSDGTATPPCVE